ncbi:MAG: hypothetical protein ACK5OX_14400 [Desertimonas sp.]
MVEILTTLASELPGDWTVRGRGMKSMLLGEPLGWAVRWIGASKASSVRMHSGVAPAVGANVSFAMGVFGLDMSELTDGPRSLALGTPDDLGQARVFAGRAISRMNELTAARYAERAERALQVLVDGGNPTAAYLAAAPGWRVVTGDADPVEAIETIRRLRPTPSPAETPSRTSTFYDTLVTRWTSGGRQSALAVLTECRDASLVEQGYGPDSIVA